MGSTTLSPMAYSSVIVLDKIPYHGRTLAVLVLLMLPVCAGWRRNRWSVVDASGVTRTAIFLVALVLGWTFSTLNTNLFLNQEHTLDRIVLIALTAAVLIHPAFVVLQLVCLLVFIAQLNFPLPEANWHYADKQLPIDALILFTAFLHVRLFFNAQRQVFVFCLLCFAAASYVEAAFLKLQLGSYPWSWIVHNDLSNITVAAYKNGGWLSGFSEQTVLGIASILERLRIPMSAGTIVFELAPLLVLSHPAATPWILAGLILLHVLILLASGIFFWKWILLHCVLIWYVRRLRTSWEKQDRHQWIGGIYQWRMVALGVFLIIICRWLFFMTPFAWADTRMSNFFVIRGIGQSGATYRLEPRFFAPYDLTIQQSRFYYALNEPVLVGTFGTSDRFDLAQALETATIDDLDSVRQRFGRLHFDENKAERLRIFLQRSVMNATLRHKRDHWLHAFAPPHHFQTTASPDAYLLQEPLTDITVTFEEWFNDGQRLIQTREVLVERIPIR